MCGIFAVLDFEQALGAEQMAGMQRVGERLAARGPDSAGTWTSPCGRVALGHRRLAIIDLSPSGAQPMHASSGRYSIVFNGEILNYRALRAELTPHYAFRTGSDTEVIMAAWEHWGAACLHRLRGMFAFALWDSHLRQLHIARDPFGIKPLYVRQIGTQVWIASQVKALASAADGLTISHTGKAGFFLWGSIPDPFTAFNEITALPAGHVRTYEQGSGAKTRDWFQFSDTLAAAAEAGASRRTEPVELVPQLRHAMLDTVAAHREADVPVGVFLSAGRDSTTLAALSCELAGSENEVSTVTLAFSEYAGTADDESLLAETVARRLGTRHSTVQISKRDFVVALPDIFSAMDQPSYDGVNTYFVSKATRAAGLKVALSGLGGDELFGGYASFSQVPTLAHAVPAWMQGPGRLVRLLCGGLANRLGKPKLAGLMEYAGSYERAYQLRRGLFMPWELDQVMSREAALEALNELATLPTLAAIHQSSDAAQIKMSLLEGAWFMRNQLLRDSDWASMAHGLELRVPLVDVELWKKILPLRLLSDPVSKTHLAMTPAHALPNEILYRPKTGFSIPVGQWLLEAEGGQQGLNAISSLRPWSLRVWDRWLATV